MAGAKYWAPRREVVLWKEEGKPLGISIVGGQVRRPYFYNTALVYVI